MKYFSSFWLPVNPELFGMASPLLLLAFSMNFSKIYLLRFLAQRFEREKTS
jgi:hypothetical protein